MLEIFVILGRVKDNRYLESCNEMFDIFGHVKDIRYLDRVIDNQYFGSCKRHSIAYIE